jgi:serine/threonine-protein kinase RsbW
MSGNDSVELTVPARDEYARTVRMAAASLAGRAGASLDALDDVRLAVEEAFIYASALGGHGGRITFRFRVEGDVFEVLVGPVDEAAVRGGTAEAPGEYARFILESLCDDFGVCDEDESSFLVITKNLGEG